jgi:hypothetical protein
LLPLARFSRHRDAAAASFSPRGGSQMSTRCLLASCLVIGAAIGFAVSEARASNEGVPLRPSGVQAGLVPDDAFFFMSAHPRRVLADESLAKFDLKNQLDFDEMAKHGFNPWDIEEFAMFVGPPAPSNNPNVHADVEHAIIVRLTKPQTAAELAAKILKPFKPEEAEVAGHKYFRAGTDPNNPRQFMVQMMPVVCFLDGRTFVMADEPWLAKILDAKYAASPLISALATADPDADGMIVFSNSDAAREFLAKEFRPMGVGGPMKPVVDSLDSLQVAKLTARTTPQISLRLTLTGADNESAAKLAQEVKDLQQVIKQQLLPLMQMPLAPGLPDDQHQARELAQKLFGKFVDGLVPQKSGKMVTVKIDNLSNLETVVGKMILPQISAERAATQRMRKLDNLRQLGLALLTSATADRHFPAHAIYSKEGKPLLSWRVYVLQYLGEQSLFKQFRLDEPWDSEHNKPLIAKMPSVYKSLVGKPLEEGKTRYVVPFGKGAIFDGDKGITLEQITDGMSNTILLLEVGEDKAVTWTKPDDLDFDPQKPLAGLGTIGDAGIAATIADGSVHVIRKGVDAETFRRLILRNDGLPIDSSKWREQ